jgi:flavin-dependent dehydrogenase
MEAGKIAGEIAAKHAKAGTCDRKHLLEYAQIYKKLREPKLLKRLMLRKVLEKLSDDDMNAVFAHLDDRDIEHLLKGNFPAVVGKMTKMFVTRPTLVKAMSALL